MFRVIPSDADISDIAAVDRIGDSEIVKNKFFHIASIIFKDTLDNVTNVVGKIKILDFAVFFALLLGKGVVLCFSDFIAGSFVDGNIVWVAILFADLFAIFCADFCTF